MYNRKILSGMGLKIAKDASLHRIVCKKERCYNITITAHSILKLTVRFYQNKEGVP